MDRLDRCLTWLRPHRVGLLATLDGAAWLLSLAVFAAVRLDASGAGIPWADVVVLAVVAGSLQFVLGGAVRLHHGRAGLGSFEELLALGAVTGLVGAAVSLINISLLETPAPRSVPLAATFMTIAVAAWTRVALRRLRERRRTWRQHEAGRPVVVIGAGEGAYQLVHSMLYDPRRAWRPVGLLDDDVLKRHRRFHGVPVLGTLADLGAVAERTGCRNVIMAIPSATRELVRAVDRQATELGLDLKVVPTVADLADGRVSVADVRQIDVTDLLGRHQIDTDLASIADYLHGKRVLVTGAGGSIGSELCRQIHAYGPAELIMLDRDESALHATQLSIYGMAALDVPGVVLADIRDPVRVRAVFEQRRPHVVFHAAALKHLTMLEQYPAEAVRTNVWGTLAVLDAARAVGVERFVNISTDKAANPCSVLGWTKRLAEALTAEIAPTASGTFLSVRFGNVLGSRGSVLTTFAAQIESGGPVTVTDERVTRYFMTVQEAVQLVVQAAAVGRDGEALVLDMGQPVRIADVARQLVEWSERAIDIVFTGLHRGEKVHEELFGDGEVDVRPVHPLISHVPVPPLDPLVLQPLSPAHLGSGRLHDEAVRDRLRRTCADLATGVVHRPTAVSA